jgi:single-stranded-DNA-specific exonuclease
MSEKHWSIRPADPDQVQRVVNELGLSWPVAQILVARGFHTPVEIHTFLNPSRSQLHDPFLFEDMEALVDRLIKAREAGEHILVYGDYDVDGLTATSVAMKYLKRFGFKADFFIPDRFRHGYGLNTDILDQAREKGVSIILTVDCGSKEIEPVEHARSIGLDVLVTDHHLMSEQEPPANMIVNPHRLGCRYPDKGLCGVGLAFKVGQALCQKLGEDESCLEEDLELVAMGSVADLAPLVGENRYLVREGMRRLRQSRRPGLRALMDISQCIQNKIGTRQIGFQLAPRINALGRLGNAAAAVRLLLTEDPAEAESIVAIMQEANSERQKLQEVVTSEIFRLADNEPERFTEPVIILSGENWHQGVVGIAASKVSDRYFRPVILFSVDGATAHGSARSIPGVHITNALSECADLLERYGGHEMASGITMPSANLSALQQRLTGIIYREMQEEAPVPQLIADAEVRLDQVDEELIEQLNDMTPFGEGNPKPLLVAHHVSAGDTARIVGNGSLKMICAQGNAMIDAIAFGQAYRLERINLNQLDVAFYAEINEWRGNRNVQLNVQDVRTSDRPAPVVHMTSATNSLEQLAGRLKRIQAGNLENSWKAFLEKRGDGPSVALVDHPERIDALKSLANGEVILITDQSPAHWQLPEQPRSLFLYTGRLGPDRTRAIVQESLERHKDLYIYLAVARDDITGIEETLADVYPDRNQLLEVYKESREAFQGDYFEIEDALLKLPGFSRSRLLNSLKVFEELELLERHSDRSRMCFRRVRARRDIEMSPTYRQGRSLHKRWTSWLNVLRSAEEDLLKFLSGA